MPKDISSGRYERLFRVITFLQKHREATRSEIEEAGGYDSGSPNSAGYLQNRTLQNDLKLLRNAGANIEYDPLRKKYVMLNFEPLIRVSIKATGDEITALRAGLKMSSHFLPHLREASDSLWRKLEVFIHPSLTERAYDLAGSTVIAVPAAEVRAEVFRALVDAKYSMKAVKIRYKSPGKSPRSWLVSPYDFYFRGNAWYMVSYNHKHKALSTHRMSRIMSVFVSSESYIPPSLGGFTEEYTSTAWNVAPGTERHPIKLRLTGSIAEAAGEVMRHPTQELHPQPDGSIILTATVPHLEEVARWVLSSSPDAVALEPPELVGMVRELAERTCMLYRTL